MDTVTKKKRSEIMSLIRSKNTRPELRLCAALSAAGVSYTKHADLPGKPDLVIWGRPIAVFVDGDFWHGCPRHYKLPKTRKAFWRHKVATNRKREHDVLLQLHKLGWITLRFWECEVTHDLQECVRTVFAAMGLYG